jgi:NADH-quinone oxidoreductase subunit N
MTLAEMQFQMPDLRLASAEIFMLLMACLILILDLFVKDRKRTVTFVATQLTLVGAAVVTFATSSGEIAYTFSNMYVGDLMGDLLKLLLYLTVIVVCSIRAATSSSGNRWPRASITSLVLFATLGMMVMISANHFLTVYLGLELLSLSLYALVAMNRDSVPATEAAMKYFVLGALASGLLLYGMSMIYGATGTLEITASPSACTRGRPTRPSSCSAWSSWFPASPSSSASVPFHMWIPDVYHGAPTAVTLFIATAPKLAAFAIVMRLLVNGLIVLAQDWQTMLILLGAVDGDRQHCRHRADQPQAHAGLFGDLAHGLHAARPGDRRGWWRRALCAQCLQLVDVLRHHLRTDQCGHLRHDSAAGALRP